jgi:RNase P/RNase MRP subunit p29
MYDKGEYPEAKKIVQETRKALVYEQGRSVYQILKTIVFKLLRCNYGRNL